MIHDPQPTPPPQPSPDGAGLECPRCGCKHFWTLNVRHKPKRIIRYRECRHCGRKMTTVERTIGDDAIEKDPGRKLRKTKDK